MSRRGEGGGVSRRGREEGWIGGGGAMSRREKGWIM